MRSDLVLDLLTGLFLILLALLTRWRWHRSKMWSVREVLMYRVPPWPQHQVD